MVNKIFIGSDHAGFKLKENLIKYYSVNSKLKFIDEGTYSKDSCDYPFYAKEVSMKVVDEDAKGILICGTGIGMSIVANKQKGIRAALICDIERAKLAKEHNDANIICLSGKYSLKKSVAIIDSWLGAKVDRKVRHKRRRAMIEY